MSSEVPIEWVVFTHIWLISKMSVSRLCQTTAWHKTSSTKMLDQPACPRWCPSPKTLYFKKCTPSSPFTFCGGLNRYGPFRLMCLNAWPIRSGAIKRCGLIKGSESLWGQALRSYMLKLDLVWQSPSATCRSRCRSSSFSSIMSLIMHSDITKMD